MLDANESWTRKQAVRHVCELERTLDLIWIEEPVRRWDAEGLAAVGRGIRAVGRHRGEPHRPRAVPPAARRRRGRHRADGRGLGGHPLPAGRRPRPRPRPAGQPDRHHPDRRCCTPRRRCPTTWSASCRTSRRRSGVAVDLHIEDGAFVLGDHPGPRHPGRRGGDRRRPPPTPRPEVQRRPHPTRTRRPPPALHGPPPTSDRHPPRVNQPPLARTADTGRGRPVSADRGHCEYDSCC